MNHHVNSKSKQTKVALEQNELITHKIYFSKMYIFKILLMFTILNEKQICHTWDGCVIRSL